MTAVLDVHHARPRADRRRGAVPQPPFGRPEPWLIHRSPAGAGTAVPHPPIGPGKRWRTHRSPATADHSHERSVA